jgi:hypothetical protein
MPAVGDLVRSTTGQWMVKPPLRCPRGHGLRPGHTLVGSIALLMRPASDVAVRVRRGHVRAGVDPIVLSARRSSADTELVIVACECDRTGTYSMRTFCSPARPNQQTYATLPTVSALPP